MVQTPGRARKAVFVAMLAVALIATVEVCSIIALYFVDGKLFSPRGAAAKRQLIQRQAEARSNVVANLDAKPPRQGSAAADEVVHPYLGYVREPPGEGRKKIGPLGFFETPAPPGPEEARFTVAVFGASLANQFVIRRRSFIEALETSPLFDGREIWVRSFAMGGYKQPQQVLALNYLLAVGERFDLVVNLDGFNDVVLGAEAYANQGISPFYPREWPNRAADLPDVASQRLIGEIAHLEHRRARKAAIWCATPPLAISPTCHLLWRLSNRRLAARADALRGTLATHPRDREFLTHGPPADYADESALFRELAGLWGRGSLQMHRLCEQSGIRYLHFLQPNQYVPGSKKLSRKEKLLALEPEHRWGRFVPAGYPRLVEEGRRLAAAGVSFHDMRMVFADVEGPVYSDPCCHLNRTGNDLLARAMARVIVRELEADAGSR